MEALLIARPSRLLRAAALLSLSCPFAGATTYYVDALSGDDAHAGTSTTQSWKTLDAVNRTLLGPGDAVLFHAGQTWRGTLAPQGRGAAGSVIRIGRYAEGPMPRIDGDGTHEDTVLLRNMDQLEVSDLEVTNRGDGTSMRRGVRVWLQDFGVAHHIVLRHLFVHDVGGTLLKKDSGGIVFQAFGDTNISRFDDLLIEHNVILHVDRSGITQQTDHYLRAKWAPSTGVVIRENYLEDIGGDGIVPLGTAHALIEGNVVRGAVSRSKDYNAGVWPWSSDDALFEWNDVSQTGGTRDGEAYDSDYNSHRTRFDHNYSHDNAGGFMLICTPGVASSPYEDIGNVGTRVVQNISRNDHARIFSISGGTDIVIEQNLILIPKSVEPMQIILLAAWKAWPSDILVTRNRIFVEGAAASGHAAKSNDNGTFELAPGWGGATNVRFDANVYLDRSNVSPLEATARQVKDAGLANIDWEGPQFNAPRDGANTTLLDQFFTRHRQWLHELFRQTHTD